MQFIEKLDRITYCGPEITGFSCFFRRERFTETDFHCCGVPMPEALKNAVRGRLAEYLAGRYLAKHALRNLGVYSASVPIGAHREPVWPDNILGSISHSADYAACVVARSSGALGVGIDAERVVDSATKEVLENHILCKEESAYFFDHELDNNELVTLAFAVKEAFFKAAFSTVRGFFDFNAVTIRSVVLGKNQVTFHLNHDIHPLFRKGDVHTASFVFINDSLLQAFVRLG